MTMISVSDKVAGLHRFLAHAVLFGAVVTRGAFRAVDQWLAQHMSRLRMV
jgi:hypothetical protein